MELCPQPTLLNAPLEGDQEKWRWYTDGAEACCVLSKRGRLLEPLPTFGPSCYALITSGVSFQDANRYAMARGYRHTRKLA
jgi:hypothetical protein